MLTTFPSQGDGISRWSPDSGTHSLGTLRSFPVAVWFSKADVSKVIFQLNGTTLTWNHKLNGFAEVNFSPRTWTYGENTVTISLIDNQGTVIDSKSITYVLKKFDEESPGSSSRDTGGTNQTAASSAVQGIVGSRHGSDSPDLWHSSIVYSLEVRSDGTGTWQSGATYNRGGAGTLESDVTVTTLAENRWKLAIGPGRLIGGNGEISTRSWSITFTLKDGKLCGEDDLSHVVLFRK